MFVFIWIVIAIIVFSIIILIHEYWHFKAARIFKVKVEEFGLWIPPKAKKIYTDKHWTDYTLNWLPLWWFVKMKWENINTFNLYNKNKQLYNNEELENAIKNNLEVLNESWEEISEIEKKEILKKLKDNYSCDSLINKPAWQQGIIVLAWVFMNFLLAVVIFSVLFMIWISPIWINNKIETNLDMKLIPTVEKAIDSWLIIKNPWVYLSPLEWSIASEAWIKDFDLVLKANDKIILNQEDLKEIISNSPLSEINLKIQRAVDNCDVQKRNDCVFENINIKITPNEQWLIWSYLIPNMKINEDFKYKYSLFPAIKAWITETYNQILFTFEALKMILKKLLFPETKIERQEAIDSIAWPIWMVDFMSRSYTNWIIFILIIWAIISINLWVFNLIPIPALDGWRFLFIVINWSIQKIFWKKAINEQTEWLIHFSFFIFLIALSILIAYNDIWRIIDRNSNEVIQDK